MALSKKRRKPASAECKVLLLEYSLLTNLLKNMDAISNSGTLEQVFAEFRDDYGAPSRTAIGENQ